MKKKPFLLCFFLILTNSFSFAQTENQFLVLLSKGENKLNHKTELKVGQDFTFSNQDSIGVDDELILRQVETGNVAFFTANGNYSTAEIINVLEKEQEKYGFKGIYYFFGEHILQGYDFRRKNITKITRDLFGYRDNENSIFYELNNNQEYPAVATYRVFNSEKVRIMWKANLKFDSYIVEIKNVLGKLIEYSITDKLYHNFKLSDAYNVTGDLAAFITIYGENQESPNEYLFYISTILEVTKLCDGIYSEVHEDYTKIFSDNANDKIIEALFFEMRGLYPDAARCFGEAIDMRMTEEEKKAHERLYDNFLHEYFPTVREDYEKNDKKIQYLECR